MEGLDFDSILGGDEIENLFVDAEENPTGQENETPEDDGSKGEGEKKEEDSTTEVVDPENLFEEEQPESVSSEKNKEGNKEKEEPESEKEDGTSPNNFYSSIANALTEEGIFPDLDDETIKKVETAEDFRDLIDAQIKAGLDERQKRINDALENGVEPTDIRKYEGTLNYLNALTDKKIEEESEEGEALRRNLIYQDFINRGYSQDKAEKFTKRTIDAGTDIADAKEALQSNKEYFQGEYNKLLKDAQDEAERATEERKAQAVKLKDSIMKDKQLFGDIEVDASMRKKVYDNISKPVYKDPKTGDYYTAIQKYEMEHRADFLKYTGLIYTLTNGFKDFDSFTKGKVKKEVRKGLRELEHTLNNTRRDNGGSLNLVTSAKEDPESFIGKGLKLDI